LLRALVDGYTHVIVDQKQVVDDKLDDVEILVAGRKVRRQIKSSDKISRPLTFGDFTDANSSLRFDRLVQTFVSSGTAAAQEYRLCATWQCPSIDDEIIPFLTEVNAPPTFVGSTPKCFRLNAARIWPQGEVPVWPVLNDPVAQGLIDREVVNSFCDRFIVELQLPKMSSDLAQEGELESALSQVLEMEIGIGRYPNQSRSVIDVAGLAISLANDARTHEGTLTPKSIASALAIRTDFGRVAQAFPVDAAIFHDRPAFRCRLRVGIDNGAIQIVVGAPGSGKSWELTRLADELKQSGGVVSRHYCYLEPGDELVERRVTANVFFGNVLAELYDAVPALKSSGKGRFSVGVKELEEALAEATNYVEGQITIIVDGLDHISRVRSSSSALTDDETDIVERLSTLLLPAGVSLVIGSQPGAHLDPILTRWKSAEEIVIPRWDAPDVMALAERHGIKSALESTGVTDDEVFARVMDALVQRADGNPLYTHYLSNGLVAGLRNGSITNARDWLIDNPAIAGNIAVYYAHLYQSASQEAQVVADLLGVIDFSVTAIELRQIVPVVASWIPKALQALAPVLTELSGQGGLRIFHESFRRFMLDEIARRHREIKDVLDPVIQWLKDRGFYEDAKSFRFLLPALRRASRSSEVLQYTHVTFVSESVCHAHPFEAIQKNLDIAIDVAGQNRDWVSLARCAELGRSLSMCFDEGQNTWSEFQKAYIRLQGATALAERLLFDGRPTYSRDEGLLACQLIDDAGGIAPWREYFDLPIHESETSESVESDHFGALSAQQLIDIAAVQGRLSIGNRSRMVRRVHGYLCQCGDGFHVGFIRKIASLLSKRVSPELMLSCASRSDEQNKSRFRISKRAGAVVRLGVADELQRQGKEPEAREVATASLSGADEPELILAAVLHGASLENLAPMSMRPGDFPIGVGENEYFGQESRVREWVASVRLIASAPESPSVLQSERSRVAGSGWYRCWLRFVISIAEVEAASRRMEAYDIRKAFIELMEDVQPFRGKPRPCDLYSIHRVIAESIEWALSFVRTEEEWSHAVQSLKSVCEGTGTRIDREDGGPLPVGTLIDLLMHYAAASPTVLSTIVEKFADLDSMGTYYSTHAEYAMKLASLLHDMGDVEGATKKWKQAGQFLAAYGWHKDVTLLELIHSTSAIASGSSTQAMEALSDLQPLIGAVLRHTDGRSTKSAPNAWFTEVLRASPIAAIKTLARTLAEDGGVESWPTVQALKDIANYALDKADPQLVDGLWRTLLFEIEYESEAADTANERLDVVSRLQQVDAKRAALRLLELAAEIYDDGRHYVDGAIAALRKFEHESSIPLPLASVMAKKDKDRSSVEPVTKLGIRSIELGYRFLAFPSNPTMVDLMAGLRSLENAPADERSERVSSTILSLGYRVSEMIENGNEIGARRLLHFFARDIRVSFSDALHPLGDVALYLANAGYKSIAAICYSLAYTASRGRGGWLAFGDKSHSVALRAAIAEDREVALSTVASEVAYRLGRSEYYAGISRQLVERVADWDDPMTTGKIWREAFEVVSHRLPLPSNRMWFASLELEKTDWSVDEGLVVLLLTRINEPRILRKIDALSSLLRSMQSRPDLIPRPLEWWLSRDTPISSVLLFFQLLLFVEESPFQITTAIQEILNSYSRCQSWGVSRLAMQLLERASLPMSVAASDGDDPYSKKPLSAERIEALLSGDAGNSIDLLSDDWPELKKLVAGEIHQMMDGVELHKERWKERFELSHGRDRASFPPTPVLGWDTEVFICALHKVLMRLPEKVWSIGEWTKNVEKEILSNVLPDLALHIAMSDCRAVRPLWTEPSSLMNGIRPLCLVEDSHPHYKGWSRIGYVEFQYAKDSKKHENPFEVIHAFAGAIALPLGRGAPANTFPFEDGDYAAWWDSALIMPRSLRVAKLTKIQDWLGETPLLIPPVELHQVMILRTPNIGEPLVWLDAHGNEALVLRTWRVRDRDQMFAEPSSLHGQDMIVRPDVLEKLIRIHASNLVECVYVSRSTS
jgi:hypothetical protein